MEVSFVDLKARYLAEKNEILAWYRIKKIIAKPLRASISGL